MIIAMTAVAATQDKFQLKSCPASLEKINYYDSVLKGESFDEVSPARLYELQLSGMLHMFWRRVFLGHNRISRRCGGQTAGEEFVVDDDENRTTFFSFN